MNSVIPMPTAISPKNAARIGSRIAATTRMTAPKSSMRLRSHSTVPPPARVVAAVVEVFPRLTGSDVPAPRIVVNTVTTGPDSTPSWSPTSEPKTGRSHAETVSIERPAKGTLSTPASPRANMAQIARTHGLATLSGIWLTAPEMIPGAFSGIASPARPSAKTVKWGSVRWLSIEAKSEEHPDGLLPLKDIRQTNTQLDQMAADADLDYAPAESQSFLICDRLAVPSEHAQVAKDNVYLVRSQVIESIAYDVRSVWKNLLGIAGKSVSREELDKHIGATLAENGCLPNQIFDRLMQYRIKESS